MHIEGDRLILGRERCSGCWGKGSIATQIPCPTCNGTGRGPRGGKRSCRSCSGFGRAYDQENRQTCPHCNGIDPEHAEAETRFSFAPKGLFASLPIEVVRQDRLATFNESWLGIGRVTSVIDYGRSWDDNDESVIANVRRSLIAQPYQASAIVNDDLVLPRRLVAIVTRDGYSVVADHSTVEVR